MQNKSRISFGPGAASIILILVILSMSILAILSLISAKGEIQLADRSVEVIRSVCALNTKAEEMAAEIDGIVAAARESGQTEEEILRSVGEQLPAGVQLSENTVSWEETDGKSSEASGNSFLRACSCRKTPFPGTRRTGRDSCHAHWK